MSQWDEECPMKWAAGARVDKKFLSGVCNSSDHVSRG